MVAGFLVPGLGSRVQVEGAGFRFQGLRCRVQSAGFKIQGSGSRVRVSGCREKASPPEPRLLLLLHYSPA